MNTKENDYEFIKFVDGDFSLDVRVSFHENTVWLAQNDMAKLFETTKQNIGQHIQNTLKENEQNSSVVKFFFTTGSDGKTYQVKMYNLDMIIAIGQRIRSPRTTKFEMWAKEVLKNINMQNYSQISQLIKFTYNNEVSIDVNVSPEEETVWLTQKDMSILFDTTVSNINIHIKNILDENELDKSVVKDYLITATDGKVYQTMMYNLDMIIAVGYRINSKRGTQFRKWATSVLKEYLLKGYTFNEQRCLTCTSNILELKNKVEEIESKYIQLEDTVYTADKMIYEGELVEPLYILRKLFFLARKRIVIIDDYVDETALKLLENIKTKTFIITKPDTYLNKVESIPNNICIIKENKEHDRVIFIDEYIYILGISFNGIGKERFALIKVKHISEEAILKGIDLDKYNSNE